MAYNVFRSLKLIRDTLLPLPGAREGICFGMIAFYAHKKLLCNLKPDGETLHLHHHDRDELIGPQPEIFFITDHHKNYPSVLIHLPLIRDEQLKQLLLNAWLLRASKTHLKQYNIALDDS